MRFFLVAALCFVSSVSYAQASTSAEPVQPVRRNTALPLPPVPPSVIPRVAPIPFQVGSSWVDNPVDTPDTVGNRPVGAITPTRAVSPLLVQPTPAKPEVDSESLPAISSSVPPQVPVVVPVQANACGNGQLDLRDLLSPACLASLRPMQPGATGVTGITAPVAVVSPAVNGVTCNVSIFAGGNPGSVSFPSPDIKQCLEAGTKMSYGISGNSNIVIVSAQGGVIGVSCTRNAVNPALIACHQQS